MADNLMQIQYSSLDQRERHTIGGTKGGLRGRGDCTGEGTK